MVENGWLYRVAGGSPYRASQQGTDIVVETDSDASAALAEMQWRLGDNMPRQPLLDLATRDEAVAALIYRYPGHRPPFVTDPFESLVTSVTAQQVNLTWALTTRRRLIHRYGTRYEWEGVEVWDFPRAQVLAAADPTEIRGMQFTTRKAEYVVGIAQAVTEGALDGIDGMSTEEATRHLTAIRGVGRWTAEWLLARCLARPEVIAAGDLGVRKAVSFSYRTSDHILDESVVRDIAEPWADATNLTVHLLLETLT